MEEKTLELARAEDRQHLALRKLDAACHVCMYYADMPTRAKLGPDWLEKYNQLIEDAVDALQALAASTDEMGAALAALREVTA